MLIWAFLHPSVHYYFGEIENIVPGVTLAGCIDAFMCVFGLGCLITIDKKEVKPFLWYPVILYCAARFYAVLISPYMEISIRTFVVGTVPILFYLNLTMMQHRWPNLSQKLAHIVILSSLFPMTIALLGMIAPFSSAADHLFALLPSNEFAREPYPGLGMPRACGATGNANEFAVFMALVLLAVILRLDKTINSIKRNAWLTLGLVIIIMTFTRSVWLTLGAVLIMLFSIFMNKKVRCRFIIMMILVVLVIAITPLSEIIYERMHETSALSDRAELRDAAIEFFKENPIGFGLGVSQTLTTGLLSKIIIVKGDIVGGYMLHNEYLTHAVEGGIILLLAYLILMFSFLRLATRAISCARNWGLWLGAATMMLAGVAFTDVGLGFGSFTFWLLVAGVEIEYQLESLPNQEDFMISDQKYQE